MCGNPPFETLDLKETYKCIKEVRYNLPSTLSPAAQKLISGILQKNPSDRLTLDQILNHEFFKVCWPSGNFLPVLRNTVVTFLSRGEGVWKCQCLICYLNWEPSGHAPTSSLFLTVFFFLMHHLCLFLRVSLLTNFPPAAVQWCQSYTLPALPRNSSLKWPKAYLERRKQKVSKQHERLGGGGLVFQI